MVIRWLEQIARQYPWIGLIWIVVGSFFSIIRNPSFIMFSIIAISLSTLGIWIELFTNGTADAVSSGNPQATLENLSIVESINKLSVFTFCIATLGGLGTDYVFEEKYLNSNVNTQLQLLARHLAFLLWFICIVLSFFALKEDWAVFPALLTTLTLWMCVNIKTAKFQHINVDAKNNLVPDYERNFPADDFKGHGL